MFVYRISRQKFANDLNGTGARLNGGRWNSPGNAILYTSSYRSLALLEILVHTTNGFVPDDLRLITIEMPDNTSFQEIKHREIKEELGKRGVNAQFNGIGDKWIQSRQSLVLKVPSIILPEEFNYLINPLHKDFSKVRIESITVFDFDKRLLVS